MSSINWAETRHSSRVYERAVFVLENKTIWTCKQVRADNSCLANILQCSVSCGQGYRTRQVECVRREEVVDDSFCQALKPSTTESCK